VWNLDVVGDMNMTGILRQGGDAVVRVFGSNTALGKSTLSLNPVGNANTATGSYALFAATSGSDNTATGSEALRSNTDGNFNTAIGSQALASNTSGFLNTATGARALAFITTGSGNTATGWSALLSNLGNDNTATGVNALSNNTDGSFNTATGRASLFHNTTGSRNTALGNSAGYYMTGNDNIAIGYNTGTSNTSGSNNIYIANDGAEESNTIRIGGSHTSFFAAGVRGAAGAGGVAVLIDPNGHMYTTSSSRRFKEDIHDMGDASNGLMRLRPVTFRYKQPLDDGTKPLEYGLIAEEVEKVYPDLVAYAADGQIQTVKYHLLAVMLLNEIQRQQSELRALEQQNRDLQQRLAAVEAALAERR